MYLLIVKWKQTGAYAFHVDCESVERLNQAADYWSSLTVDGVEKYAVEKFGQIREAA